MITPQEIQDRSSSLEKAVFGGYSVDSVEELLTPLSQDYATLYKENAVLKSKMKVLVDRLEEYRKQEESINKALLAAQKTADDLVAEAQRKCAKMMSDTEQKLRQRSQDLRDEVEAETQRVALAKESAAKFIVEIEDRVQSQLSQLERIKQLDIQVGEKKPKATKIPTTPAKPAAPAPKPAAPAPKPTPAPAPDPIPAPLEDTLKVPVSKQEKPEPDPDLIARQIEENINRLMHENQDADGPVLDDTRAISPMG
jgi:cell division initiation protein